MAVIRALSTIGFSTRITMLGQTDQAPGQPYGSLWWKLRGESLCGDRTASPNDIAVVLYDIVKGNQGWILGFNPNWGVSMRRCDNNRCVLGFTFALIWPKVL